VKNSFKLGEALKKAPKKVVKKKAKVVKKKVVKKKAKASPRTPALPPKTLDRSIPIYAKHKKYILINI